MLGRFLRQSLPTIIAVGFFLLALGRPDNRTLWLALGLVFLLTALRRRRSAEPPVGPGRP